MKKLSERLKEFGLSRYGSIKLFAHALEMQPSNLQAYLRGEREPGPVIIKKLSALGCDLNWLFNGEGFTEDNTAADNPFTYRVDATIPAGKGEIVDLTDWVRSEVLDYSPQEHALLVIDEEFGYSMTPVIQPGDYVMYSYNSPAREGDLVAAKWDMTKGAVKIFNTIQGNPDLIALTSLNQAVAPIILKRAETVLFRIVMLIKRSGYRYNGR